MLAEACYVGSITGVSEGTENDRLAEAEEAERAEKGADFPSLA
jgi:hypothetical protein